MDRAQVIGLLVAAASFAAPANAATDPRPVAVSPGLTAAGAESVTGPCPAFSWTLGGGGGHELLVYELGGPALEEARVALELTLPAGATSWSPPRGECLEPGKRYAWTVRAPGGDWAEPALFRVDRLPSREEAERALAAGALSRRAPGAEAGAGPDREGSETGEGSAPERRDSSRPSATGSVAPRAGAGTLLSVSGGIEAAALDTTGAITSASSLSLDGTTDTITAASGSLSFADENLTTTGTTTTGGLTITGLDCSGNANGGALTAGAGGGVTCSDDDVGQIAADSIDFELLADALTADATTTVDLDTAGADIDIDDATLYVDSSANRIGIGTATPAVALDVDGDITATGTITAVGGIDLGMGSLGQVPGTLTLAGSLGLGALPHSVFVSGRYAYVVDRGSADLKVIDVSNPGSPTLAGSLGIGSGPVSVFVSGRYAYVVDRTSDDLKVIDVSDPGSPTLAGSLGLGTSPFSVFVSGRYAYVVDQVSDDLKVIDISDPGSPTLAGSLAIGTSPVSVFVSGRYAYVVDVGSSDLKVIDVSDPGSPTLAGSLGIGASPASVFVSGRYAYVVDFGSDDLKVIDVSDPGSLTLAGSLGIGTLPFSVFVSGRYAYVVDQGSDDLKVIDVSDAGSPTLAGSLGIGTIPLSVFVSGRYAYVVDEGSVDLKVIDVTGAEFSAAIVHSLEAGSLQVRESLITQGQLQVSGGATIGPGGLFSDGNVGISGTLALANDIVPSSSPANAVQLYAEDVAASAELKVRDEAGNVTTLSPHNFSLVGAPSEPLAWSFYSENESHGRINVDMLRTVRLVEQLAGERLVHARAPNGSEIESPLDTETSLRAEVEALRHKSEVLQRANRELELELERIKKALGIE